MSHEKNNPNFLRRVLKRWYIHLFLWPISLPIEFLAFIYHPNQVEKRKEAAKKKQAYLESLPKEEKEAYLEKKASNRRKTIRLSLMLLFWLILGSVAFMFYFEPGRAYQVWIGFAPLFLAIWLQPAKGEGFLKNRFKQFKEHKIRIGLTVAAFVLTLILLVPLVMEEITEKKELAEQEFIDNYPEPTIEVVSSIDHQGNAKEYKLEVRVEDASSVYADDKEMIQDTKNKSLYRLTIPLDEYITENIDIEAKNEYKEAKETITITRNETEQEKEERIAREAKEREEKILILQAELEKRRLAREAEEEKRKEEEKLAQEAQLEKEKLAQQEMKFGLTKEQRKQIFREITLSEDRARKEAEAKYPFPDMFQSGDTQAFERLEYNNELQEIYKNEVLSKYGIDNRTAIEITLEGVAENWPMPE